MKLVVEDKAALMERYHSGQEENMGYSIRGDWRMNDRKGVFCWMHKRHARAT
jgi:hypothetical protein